LAHATDSANRPKGISGNSVRAKANGVGNCPTVQTLRGFVDDFLATPHPDFPGLGSTIPGTSVSFIDQDCGTFTYAAGLRNIEDHKQLTPATLMGIASMTKPIIAAVTLILNDRGVFGPNGLDTKVDQLLTGAQIQALTIGSDPSNPRCPGVTFLFNRDTGNIEPTPFGCPDLSQVSLRDLMRANHGMYDFVNEVFLPDGFRQYSESVYFELYQFLGLNPIAPPSSERGFDYMKAYGLKQNLSATVGGSHVHDFERSFGNTGFQLLGIILEQQTAMTLDQLIAENIVAPLRLDPIVVYTDTKKQNNLIADGYEVYTGEPLIEQTGIYPLLNLHGHTAVNTLSLGLGVPGNINFAGGAGSLIANPKSYQKFLDAFTNGSLLPPQAQSELNNSFILVPELSPPQQLFYNGYGLVKVKLRDIPGFPNIDVLYHDGSLPGVLCFNSVARAPDSEQNLTTGVVCQNSNSLAYPDQFDLFFEILDKILEKHGITPN
jgi:CubicO group peptidase (beta-lactamase class C family)